MLSPMGQPLRVLDAARQVRDEVNRLLRTARPPLIYQDHLRRSAGGIANDIRDAFGRSRGPERNQYLHVARSEAEETAENLLANHRDNRLTAARYWSLHNRLVTIVKMLNRTMDEPSAPELQPRRPPPARRKRQQYAPSAFAVSARRQRS